MHSTVMPCEHPVLCLPLHGLLKHVTVTHPLRGKQVPPFKKTLLDAMPYIDFLFGNETEARAFADSEDWGTQDIPEIALKVTGSPPRSSAAPPGQVRGFVTQGQKWHLPFHSQLVPAVVARNLRVCRA